MSTLLLSLSWSRVCPVVTLDAGAGEDPWPKQRNLITDLINRLQSEASSEASHKSHCDDELSEANEKKVDLETQVATHSSKLEAAVSKSSVLYGEVAELQADLGALSALQPKMDAMRVDERKIFATAKENLEQSIESRRRWAFLREYNGASFVQQTDASEVHQSSGGA